MTGASFVYGLDYLVPHDGNVLMVIDVSIHNQNTTDDRSFNGFRFSARDVDRAFTFRRPQSERDAVALRRGLARGKRCRGRS